VLYYQINGASNSRMTTNEASEKMWKEAARSIVKQHLRIFKEVPRKIM
jgi:hypothetical protein